MWFWLWTVLLGALVGIIARLIHPGKENMGWLLTILIGIIGLVVGRAIGNAIGWSSWISFVIGIVIAFILIVIYGAIRGKK